MIKKISALLFTLALISPISIYANSELIVGGESIGIEVNYEGVMITGTYTISINDELYDPSSNFMKGDILKKADGVELLSLKDLYNVVNKFQDTSNDITVVLDRNGEQITTSLKTAYDATTNSYKSGLYVKDKIVGVGTMTYYDPLNQTYGALGHEIMDTDIHEIADIKNGVIYSSDVTSLTKSQAHIAGEKHATINFNDELGLIKKNTPIGIYGTYQNKNTQSIQLEWANKEEIVLGPATIYTVLEGSNIEEFAIEITKVHKQSESSIKGIEFVVTDDLLLNKTNGIIQGMSGSPILQNGKIIGAVTHVVLDNPASGYGVFIEWMLQESDNAK